MSVVGFNFSKMVAERKKAVRGRLTINNTVTIIDVEETKLPVDAKGKSLKLTFGFSTKYEPDAGAIELNGEVFYLDTEERIKETLKEWKAKKSLPEQATEEILNNILAKCHIEAVMLSRDINLPPPVALPKVGIAAPAENPPAPEKKK